MDAATTYTPLPYQYTGANFLADRRYAGLFDEMGVGKTAQAVMAADMIGAQKILVIAPKIALVNWQREIVRWAANTDSRSAIITNNAFTHGNRVRWELVNYDLLQTVTPALLYLRKNYFSLLILD